MPVADRVPSVLIVEDEAIVAADLQQTLSGLGYDAFAIAASGDEALQHARQQCPDIVLMDIRIKGQRDGIETAAALRGQFGVPVVYLTAHADDATLERAKRTEPHGYLVKPVNPAELKSAIEVSIHRNAMERQLRERERWFATTLQSIADAVITVDLAGKVSFMNPTAERLTGVPQAAALGRPAREVVRLTDSVQPASPLDHVLQHREPLTLAEASLARASGEARQISDTVAPVIDGGEMLGAVMVFRDITEHKRVARQLEVADRLASLGTMAAGVAHEVNNPLAVVLANSTFVLAELERQLTWHGEDPALAEAIVAQRDLAAAAARIGRIIGELGAFSRPHQAAAAEASVAQAVDWAVRTTSPELRGIAAVEREIGPLPPAAIDGARLGQAIAALLVNAARAMDPVRASSNRVTISAAMEGERVVIAVRDTGAGIPPEVQPRIFEPFFTTRPGASAGLGLAICHGIIASAGGAITVESRVGHGALFRIALPAVARPVLAARAVSDAAPRRGRILVIDDEPLVLRAMSRMLREHEVTLAGSALEALAVLGGDARFDLIFSDVMMPQMTGVQLYERLAAERPALAGRIVFLSGGILGGEVADFMATIPNPCLEKPLSFEELRAVITARVAAGREL